MLDPDEGVGPAGEIRTGVARDRVAPVFEPVLAEAARLLPIDGDAGLSVYGSVATGRAMSPRSDVDLLMHGVDPLEAAVVQEELSRAFRDRCRAVEIAVAGPEDALGGGSSAYGLRVFLRHYCAPVAGVHPWAAAPPYPADRAAAAGFNGDIARARHEWRALLALHADGGAEAVRPLGRRIARKALLALTGVVSVVDGIWTTDRATAVRRWAAKHSEDHDGLLRLAAVSEGDAAPSTTELHRLIDDDGAVGRIETAFAQHVGLWDHETTGGRAA